MNIKTITTTDGVNTVDFGSAASRFYWFRNIGTTTVYVSGNSDISAGGDGVAELPSGGSVCIETLGGKVYILGEGKVQIHNTGDKFCPFKNAPAQSGGEAVDAYTKSESDARYAQKTDVPDSYTKTESDTKYAQKAEIPVSLPANGGNADTVDGLHASDFVRAFNNSEMNNNKILIPNDVHVGNWLAANAEVGIQYYKDTNCSGQTGLPDGANDWAWFVYDGLIYIAKTSYNRFFIMDYINSYNGWKEISTTPIKSTTVSGTTDINGNLMLWAASENKIPICAILSGYCSSIFYYAPHGKYYLGVSDINRQAYSPNVPISGTVYYI